MSRKQPKGTRVFTLGIGRDALPELVNGIARAGQGQAEFVISGERLEAKVLRQLKRALQPVLKQPVLKLATSSDCSSDAEAAAPVSSQAPDPLPAVFEGERMIAYFFFNTTDVAWYQSLTITLTNTLDTAVLQAKRAMKRSPSR